MQSVPVRSATLPNATLYYAMLRHANLRHVTLGRDIVGGADDVVVFHIVLHRVSFGNK